MELHKKNAFVASCFVFTLAAMLTAGSTFAEEILRIQPIKYDCGVVNEGVPAIMTATVENISNDEIHVSNVKVN